MNRDRSQMTEKILDFTLEIVYLLTGEDYIFMKKNEERVLQSRGLHVSGTFSRSQSPSRYPPRDTLTQERKHDQKILKLTNQIVHLLTGEVWEYIEGNGDLYKDMVIETPQPLGSLDESVGKNVFDGFHNTISSLDCFSEKESYVMNNLMASKPATQKKNCIVEVIEDSSSSEDSIHLPKSPDYQSTPIKEESVSCQEEYIAETDICTPTDRTETEYPSAPIKEEPASCEEENLTDNYIYSPTEHAHSEYPSNHFKEESASRYDGNFTDADLYAQEECTFPIQEYNRGVAAEERSLSLFICNYCGKNFSNKSVYDIHVRTHTADGAYHRPTYDNRLTSNLDHRKHQTVHNGKKLACTECGKKFSHKSGLNAHQRSHTGVKPYPCSECGAAFTQKSNLIRHMRTHTGEKPFSCSDCGKSFTRKSELVRHQRAHTGEKPFACSECGKCFSQKPALIKHRRIHTGDRPHICFLCGKSFAKKSDLISHQRIHTG